MEVLKIVFKRADLVDCGWEFDNFGGDDPLNCNTVIRWQSADGDKRISCYAASRGDEVYFYFPSCKLSEIEGALSASATPYTLTPYSSI